VILPTKRLGPDRALLAIGAEVVEFLEEPKTVSRVWDELQRSRSEMFGVRTITYDWFVLTLDLLYTLGALELERGLLRKARR
jgi:hypothetical protein